MDSHVNMQIVKVTPDLLEVNGTPKIRKKRTRRLYQR